MIDEIDRKILNIIQKNARISNADIAREIGLAPSATLERVRKLEERGVIQGYFTKIDAEEVGLGLTAFVAVKTHECCVDTDRFLAEIPEVLEVHDLAGEDAYFLKVKVKDTKALSKLLRNKLRNDPNVASTNTTVVLKTIKESIGLLIEQADKEKTGSKKRKK